MVRSTFFLSHQHDPPPPRGGGLLPENKKKGGPPPYYISTELLHVTTFGFQFCMGSFGWTWGYLGEKVAGLDQVIVEWRGESVTPICGDNSSVCSSSGTICLLKLQHLLATCTPVQESFWRCHFEESLAWAWLNFLETMQPARSAKVNFHKL